MINWVSSDAWAHALGWAILHSLWQSALISGIGLVGLRLMRRRLAANIQYGFAVGLLLAAAVLFAATAAGYFAHPASPEPAITSNITGPDTAALSPAAPAEAAWNRPMSTRIERHLRWLVMAWSLGVLILGARQLGFYFFITQLKYLGLSRPEEKWLQMLDSLQQRYGLARAIRFFESALAKDMMVVGHFKPYILAPVGLMAGLTPAQVEALLLHELAHIRRNDFLVNLLLCLLEVLLFYHPGVWWLSRRIRQLREECCDNQVLSTGANRYDYAEALARAARFSQTSKYPLVMAASSHFAQRIHRLLQPSPEKTLQVSRPIALSVAVLLFLSLAAFTGVLLGGQHTVSIAADKMNVLYIGVDNPLTIAVAGIPNEQVEVKSEDVTLLKTGEGRYNARPKKEGKVAISVSGNGLPQTDVVFRSKRLPDPLATLQGRTGGNMNIEQFRQSVGLEAKMMNLEFDASCKVLSYNFIHVPPKQDPVEVVMHGPAFTDTAKKVASQAESGSVYYFDNVLCECPGDEAPRQVNSLVFKVK
ncbi:MAG: M48 family metalloprotease [Lewinellaceae bacterium]|nr:M48 family metalloprotease [Lewinellaceae bacterium]